jgi:hypothetical protein
MARLQSLELFSSLMVVGRMSGAVQSVHRFHVFYDTADTITVVQ